jgi:soluble cytochrome b562
MDQSMKRMATAFKNLGKALKAPDAAQQETYIQWAATIKTEAVKCKDFVPVKISEMPAAQQAPVLKDYQKDMDAFIVSAGVLEKALQEKRWADADAAMKVLGKEKSSGHKQFQKGE